MRYRLERDGWNARAGGRRSEIITPHSVTLRHLAWSCEIDLHRYYPGFMADPQRVFDALWVRHVSVAMGGIEVPIADPVGNAAILALHSQRNEFQGQTHADYLDLVAHASELEDSFKHGLSEFASETGAHRTLSTFLRDIGAPAPKLGKEEFGARQAWDVMSVGAPIPGVPWVFELSRSKLWRWPGILWRNLLLVEEDMLAIDTPDTPGPLRLWRTRFRRLVRGLHTLPAALRIVLSARRRGGDS